MEDDEFDALRFAFHLMALEMPGETLHFNCRCVERANEDPGYAIRSGHEIVIKEEG